MARRKMMEQLQKYNQTNMQNIATNQNHYLLDERINWIDKEQPNR